jgi:hypothetical protein
VDQQAAGELAEGGVVTRGQQRAVAVHVADVDQVLVFQVQDEAAQRDQRPDARYERGQAGDQVPGDGERPTVLAGDARDHDLVYRYGVDEHAPQDVLLLRVQAPHGDAYQVKKLVGRPVDDIHEGCPTRIEDVARDMGAGLYGVLDRIEDVRKSI